MKKFFIILAGILNFGAICVLWYLGSSSLLAQDELGGKLIALGRLSGLFLEFFILLQLVLISRIGFIEQQFGHDKLNRVHRLGGYLVVWFLILHPALLIFGYGALSGATFFQQLWIFLNHWEDVAKAAIALVLILTAAGASAAIIKKRLRYETWHGVHLLMYLAVALAFGHQINTADVSIGWPLYYWLCLNFFIFGLLLLFRFLRPVYLLFHHKFYIAEIKEEAKDVYSIYIKGNNIDKFKFQPGQFANLTFLSKKMWFSHPFSFSSAPNREFIRFSVKALGDFTGKINSLPLSSKVIIDGPLGIMTKTRASKNKFLLLASGIGITPIFALAEELSLNKKDTILLYGNKTNQDVVFEDDLKKLNIKKYFLLSREKNKTGFEHGRITMEKIHRLAPDFMEREIYVCGPDEMIASIVADLKNSGLNSGQIHSERFAYA